MNARTRAGAPFRARLTGGLVLCGLSGCSGADQPAGPGPPPPPPPSPELCSTVGNISSPPSLERAPYDVIDLGTLGGPGSTAIGINDEGWVVGISDLPATVDDPEPNHAFLWTPAGGMTDLAPEYPNSVALDINNNRQAAGWVDDGSRIWAALWTLGIDGTVVELTRLGPLDISFSSATAINDQGQIVGQIGSAGRFTSDRAQATLWTIQADGSIETKDLGVLGGSAGFEARGSRAEWSAALGINELGQVVGQSAIGINDCSVVWTADGDIGPVGPGMEGSARRINDLGEIVGHVGSITLGATFAAVGPAYRWSSDGGLVPLDTFGGSAVAPFAINNRGQVVGRAETEEGPIHAFVWTAETGMLWLDPGNTSTFNTGRGINDHGLIVGFRGFPGTAVLWVPN